MGTVHADFQKIYHPRAAISKRGVRQYLAELATPELSARVADAVVDLTALGSGELAADLRKQSKKPPR